MKHYLFNITSDYSFFQSMITENNLAKNLILKGYQGAGVADLNNLTAQAAFCDELNNNKLKYFYELKVNININDSISQGIIIVKDVSGYYNLLKIYNIKKEIINLQDIAFLDINSGLFFILLSSSIKNETDNLISSFNLLKNHFTQVYIGVEIYSKEDALQVQEIYKICDDNNISCLVTPNCKYLEKSDLKSYKLLTSLNDSNADFLFNEEEKSHFHILTSATLTNLYREKDLINTENLGDTITYNFITDKKGCLFSINNDISKDLNTLKNIIYGKLKKFNFDKDYYERAEHELSIIEKMQFASYFLIVSDYVNYAKNNNIYVGPGRGSSGGCLISYLLNITEIDPIKFNLSFARFLNEGRKDLPDIDVDFEDTKRNEVIDYLIEKYGHDKVANIVTFTSLKPRSVLRLVGKKLKYNESQLNKLISVLSPTCSNFDTEYKTNFKFKELLKENFYLDLIKLSKPLLHLKTNTSVHAAGIIIFNENLQEKIPVQINENGVNIALYEYKYIEKIGFIKMDILGLSNLSFIRNIDENISNIYGKNSFSLNKLNDIKSYEVLNKLLLANIFQLSGKGIQYAIKNVNISNFNELVAILALYRPGPMDNINKYSSNKNNKIVEKSFSPIIDSILKETYGIIIYQEQIIEICSRIGNLTQSEADLFRRAMSKKDEKKMLLYKEKFIQGAIENKLTSYQANKLFDQIYKFSSYGFNKSHSVSYSLITYKLLYYKANYPKAFYKASFENESISDNYLRLRSELQNFDIKLLNPCVLYSQDNYHFEANNLYMPLKMINNLNENIIFSILKIENRKSINSIFEFFYKLSSLTSINDSLKTLINSGSLDIFNIPRVNLLEKVDMLNLLIENMTSSNEKIDLNDTSKADYTLTFLREIEAIGIFNSESIYKHFKKDRRLYTIYLALDNPRQVSQNLYIVNSMSEIKYTEVKFSNNVNLKPYTFYCVRNTKNNINQDIEILKE